MSSLYKSKKEEFSFYRSIGIITPHNKRTYGSKSRARSIRRGTANGALTSPSNVDTPRDPDLEEEEEVAKLSISTKGTPRQNPRGSPAAEETDEGAQDAAVIDRSDSEELPSDQGRAKNAKNASRQSPPTRRRLGSDASAAPEPERPAISPNGDSSKVNRLPFSPAIDRISPTSAQADPPDEVDGGSAQSVEVPVPHLPKRRRGRPKKSNAVPKEDSPSTLTPQPITLGNPRDGLGSNGKGKCVPQLYTEQLIYAQVQLDHRSERKVLVVS